MDSGDKFNISRNGISEILSVDQSQRGAAKSDLTIQILKQKGTSKNLFTFVGGDQTHSCNFIFICKQGSDIGIKEKDIIHITGIKTGIQNQQGKGKVKFALVKEYEKIGNRFEFKKNVQMVQKCSKLLKSLISPNVKESKCSKVLSLKVNNSTNRRFNEVK